MWIFSPIRRSSSSRNRTGSAGRSRSSSVRRRRPPSRSRSQGMDTPRPMTHDLIRDLLEALDADVVRVVVTELKSATYFAEIVLRAGDRELAVSSRPSDAVAVAVRTATPLFVADDLMDAEGIMLAVDEDEDEEPGVRRGADQPRGTGRRVPELPRLDPPRGLLALRSLHITPPDPAAEPIPPRSDRRLCDGLGAGAALVVPLLVGGAALAGARADRPRRRRDPPAGDLLDEPAGDHHHRCRFGFDRDEQHDRPGSAAVFDGEPGRLDRGQLGRRGHHRGHRLAAQHGCDVPASSVGYPGWQLLGPGGADAPDDGDPKGRLQLHRDGADGRAALHRSVGRIQPRATPTSRSAPRRAARRRPRLEVDTPDSVDHLTVVASLAPCGRRHARRLAGVRGRPVHDRIDCAACLTVSGTGREASLRRRDQDSSPHRGVEDRGERRLGGGRDRPHVRRRLERRHAGTGPRSRARRRDVRRAGSGRCRSRSARRCGR